jgi:hypothetical protein
MQSVQHISYTFSLSQQKLVLLKLPRSVFVTGKCYGLGTGSEFWCFVGKKGKPKFPSPAN